MTADPTSQAGLDDRTDDDRGFAFASAVTDAALAHAPADFTHAERMQLANATFGAAVAWMKQRTLAKRNVQ